MMALSTKTMPKALVGKTVGFIGGGAMASSMISGLLTEGVPCGKICAADPFKGSREKLEKLGVHATESNVEVARRADVLVLAVKPNVVVSVLQEIFGSDEKFSPLIVSIAAGVSIETMDEASFKRQRIIRSMPNTPCLVGEAAVGIAKQERATADDVETAKSLFKGICVEVAEKDLDAVTALSGSGPAYVFLFIEALADAGVRAGLSRSVALTLAAQTVKGAAAMQLETATHPGVLKDMVTSPGGTTIAGVEALERHGFRYAAMSAVHAAYERSKEMKQQAKEDAAK